MTRHRAAGSNVVNIRKCQPPLMELVYETIVGNTKSALQRQIVRVQRQKQYGRNNGDQWVMGGLRSGRKNQHRRHKGNHHTLQDRLFSAIL